MKKRLLIICGPTATGKTTLGLRMGKAFNGEIISADSRQVYKQMDVITGKDLNENSSCQRSSIKVKDLSVCYYTIEGIKVWGYDLVEPNQEFSVSIFRQFATKIISELYKKEKLPIVVGGTGLYIDSLIKPLTKISIPKNKELRQKLSKLGKNDLYRRFRRMRPGVAMSMNPSDRSNPNRLIRAIEIAVYENNRAGLQAGSTKGRGFQGISFDDVYWVGLDIKPRSKLYDLIDHRVDKRIGGKLTNEINYLRQKDLLRYVPSRTLGYKQWLSHIKGEIDKDEVVRRWKKAEQQYAKRQLTWFRKNKDINWFDVGNKGYIADIENEVKKWYSSDNG